MSKVKEIREALENRKKNLASAEYRLKKLDNTIPKIHTALAQAHDPSGAVVNGYINQSQSTINFIEEIIEKVENDNDVINMNGDIIENTEQTDGFNPEDYTQDIQFIKLTSEYKVEVITSKFLGRKVAFP